MDGHLIVLNSLPPPSLRYWEETCLLMFVSFEGIRWTLGQGLGLVVVIIQTGLIIHANIYWPSLCTSVSLNVSLSVGAGVFSASSETDDSNHLYGRSFNWSHHIWWPVRQVIILFHRETCLKSRCVFSSVTCVSVVGALWSQMNHSLSLHQVWEAGHSYLVVSTAGSAWL